MGLQPSYLTDCGDNGLIEVKVYEEAGDVLFFDPRMDFSVIKPLIQVQAVTICKIADPSMYADSVSLRPAICVDYINACFWKNTSRSEKDDTDILLD